MKIIRNTWFSSRSTLMKGLSLSDNFLWVSFRCCQRQLWSRPRMSASGSHNWNSGVACGFTSMESPQWSHQVHSCNLDVLGSDAPSEPVSFVIQSQGKYSTSSPTTAPEMLAPEVTSGLHAEVSLIPISFMSQ
jgi:hypothetical protein